MNVLKYTGSSSDEKGPWYPVDPDDKTAEVFFDLMNDFHNGRLVDVEIDLGDGKPFPGQVMIMKIEDKDNKEEKL